MLLINHCKQLRCWIDNILDLSHISKHLLTPYIHCNMTYRPGLDEAGTEVVYHSVNPLPLIFLHKFHNLRIDHYYSIDGIHHVLYNLCLQYTDCHNRSNFYILEFRTLPLVPFSNSNILYDKQSLEFLDKMNNRFLLGMNFVIHLDLNYHLNNLDGRNILPHTILLYVVLPNPHK